GWRQWRITQQQSDVERVWDDYDERQPASNAIEFEIELLISRCMRGLVRVVHGEAGLSQPPIFDLAGGFLSGLFRFSASPRPFFHTQKSYTTEVWVRL